MVLECITGWIVYRCKYTWNIYSQRQKKKLLVFSMFQSNISVSEIHCQHGAESSSCTLHASSFFYDKQKKSMQTHSSLIIINSLTAIDLRSNTRQGNCQRHTMIHCAYCAPAVVQYMGHKGWYTLQWTIRISAHNLSRSPTNQKHAVHIIFLWCQMLLTIFNFFIWNDVSSNISLYNTSNVTCGQIFFYSKWWN